MSEEHREPRTETREERRRRLAAVFGDDLLPETTSDERDPEPPGAVSATDAWLRSQVPPHHG